MRYKKHTIQAKAFEDYFKPDNDNEEPAYYPVPDDYRIDSNGDFDIEYYNGERP